MVDEIGHKDDVDSSESDLQRQLDETVRRISTLVSQFTTWNLYIGGRPIRRRMSTSDIAKIFAAWHIVALLAGIMVSIFWVDDKGLGVALVVGSLFGIGSFLSQFWSQAMDRERDFVRANLHAAELDELRRLALQARDLEDEIAQSDLTDNDNVNEPSSGHRPWTLRNRRP